MQNLLELQDKLKGFSDQQLTKEIQFPSSGVPSFLVLGELNRRQTMRLEQERSEAANAPTVAEEVVMAAGMGDVSQMAQAMAPKTSMTENTGIAAMMPKQPTRMATGGVVKMQEAGNVQEQIDKVMAQARANPNSITNTFKAAMIERALDGNFGKTTKIEAARAAIAGDYGLKVQRQVLAEALAGEYGDEIQESAEKARGVLEQARLRGFEPEDSQLASAAATAENVVPQFKSGLRGFTPTDTQLAPTASRAETVAPQLKSGLRGFEPTGNQLAPMGAVAEVVEPAKFPTIQAGAGIRGADTKPARELAELLGNQQLLPGVDLPGPSTTYEIDPTAALRAGASLSSQQATGMPAMRDPAVIDPTTGQPYDVLGSMRQQAEQTRQAEAQAAFDRSLPTPDELMVPFNNTRDLFDPQGLNQQRAERDRILANENQRLIEEAAEMKERLDKQRAESNFMNPDRFNRTPEDKLKSPEEQFAELGATKQVIDGEEFFVTPIGNTYDSNGRLVQGGKAIQAIQSAQGAGEDFTAGGALPTSKLPLVGTDTVGPSLNFFPDITNIPFGSYDVDAEGNVIPESYKKAEIDIGNITTPNIIKKPTSNLASFLGVDEGSAPVTDVASAINQIAKNRAINPNKDSGQGLTGETIAGDPRIAAGVVGETVKEDKTKETPNVEGSLEAAEKAVLAESEALRTNNRGFTPNEDLIEEETAAVINSAANTIANKAGEDALGARGPEAAKAAQQGFDKRMWMNIAMYGLIASEGTAKSRSEAAKTFLAMNAKDKALETKERIAIGDRESREKVAGIRSEATQANTEARIRSAALNRDFRVLESIQEELKEDIAALMPLNPKEPISPQNKDAYETLTQQLKKTRELIKNLGTFDLGPGSSQTEIAGSYNVVGT